VKRAARVVLLLMIVGAAVGAALWSTRDRGATDELVLYGNVDLRQVELAFNGSQRIAEVLVQEGDHVRRGQLVARLDTSRLAPQLAQAEAQVAAQGRIVERLHHGSRHEEIAQARAQVAAQQQIVERLHHGSRPEEIDEARADVDAAKANATVARQKFNRVHVLLESKAVTPEEFDTAKAVLDAAEAKVVASQKRLDLAVIGPRKEDIAEAEARLAATQQVLNLAVIGPRKEDIAEAEAQLQAAQAHASLVRQELADAELFAPIDAVVRARIMEPGEMASPQKPVLSLAILDPKWVRAYVSEPDLGRIHPGMAASVSADFTDQRFEGWIGFISPVAEFTPKAVQTEELRTSLVYEVRVFVKDPADLLRLGMPATVHLPSKGPASAPAKEPRS
jgi:HlyD family secretion protein